MEVVYVQDVEIKHQQISPYLQIKLLVFLHYLFNNTTACFNVNCVQAPSYSKQCCYGICC
jgi:hypothetical protein